MKGERKCIVGLTSGLEFQFTTRSQLVVTKICRTTIEQSIYDIPDTLVALRIYSTLGRYVEISLAD